MKNKVRVLMVPVVLIISCLLGATALAGEIGYDDQIPMNDPSIRIINNGTPVQDDGITTDKACNHSNSYLINHRVIGYEYWSTTQHVVVYEADRYCNTCKKVVATGIMYERNESHQNAPCTHCGYDPYA